VRVGRPGRRDDLGLGRVRAAQQQVVPDRAVEQEDVLQDQRDAGAASSDAACYGQLVAFAAHPHEGFTGHGLAHDAPGHGFDTTAELQEWLRSFCS
jgi:hypothetical protein